MARASYSATAAAAFLWALAFLVAAASGARLTVRAGGAGFTVRAGGGASATAVFALGSFWRSEAAFGCLPGVIRTSVGYASGSRPTPSTATSPTTPSASRTLEARLAALTKEREQAKDRSSIITTQIQPVGVFHQAEPEHQKFELKRRPFLVQLAGNLPEEELLSSTLAAKLNAYAADLCPPKTQKRISSKIDEIAKKGWPILRDI